MQGGGVLIQYGEGDGAKYVAVGSQEMFAPVPPRNRVSESTRNDTLRTCILSGKM